MQKKKPFLRGARIALNKARASFFSGVAKAADATDKNVARPLVKAQNRVKVKILQTRQAGIDTFAATADAADKGIEVVKKWGIRFYVVFGLVVVVLIAAQFSQIAAAARGLLGKNEPAV